MTAEPDRPLGTRRGLSGGERPANPRRVAEPRDDRKAVERLCIVTRAVRPVSDLIRFVVAPDGVLTADLRRRLPGRGVWVTATRVAVEEARRKRAFVRSLKQAVEVPEDLADRIEGLMARSALDMLSMANKAGLVAPGFSKTMERVDSGTAAAVIQAADGAPDGARKVAAAMVRTYLEDAPPTLITFLTSAQISLALGRADVIHAALGRGPATAGFLDRIAALEAWRGLRPRPGSETAGTAGFETAAPGAGSAATGSGAGEADLGPAPAAAAGSDDFD